MRISNDFHRELAAKHLRQLRLVAIIGALVARVERVSMPVLPPERSPEAAVPSRRAFYEIKSGEDTAYAARCPACSALSEWSRLPGSVRVEKREKARADRQ